MDTTLQITKDIKRLQARRAELTAELATIQGKVSESRATMGDAVLAGEPSAKTAEALRVLELRAMALDAAIESADRDRARLVEVLGAAQKEKDEAAIARLEDKLTPMIERYAAHFYQLDQLTPEIKDLCREIESLASQSNNEYDRLVNHAKTITTGLWDMKYFTVVKTIKTIFPDAWEKASRG